jgi:hypothetical protein
VAWHGAVLSLGGSLADRDHIGAIAAACTSDRRGS